MISSILLAAGQSTRMGGNPKALLDWGGEPLIRYQVQQLLEAGVDEVVVVVGYRADEVHRKVGDLKCRVMVNARYFAGRASSLRIGGKAVSRDAESIVLLNVDQPRSAEFIRQLIAAHDPGNAATRPVIDGHHGHPVIVSGALREEMMAARDETDGLRGVLSPHADKIADVPMDATATLDVNTPDDYRAALQVFGLAR